MTINQELSFFIYCDRKSGPGGAAAAQLIGVKFSAIGGDQVSGAGGPRC